MEFIDLKAQYQALKKDIDEGITDVLNCGNYILGEPVKNLEKEYKAIVP